MAFPSVEIRNYPDRPNIFAIRLPSGRWHDFDRATLAAEWAWYYHLAKCDNHVVEALQVQIQNAVDTLNELDGVIPFTEALGKGDATEYDNELTYLAGEVSRLSIEGATYLWAHTVNPLVACTVIGTENSVESTEEGARWALIDAAYLARLRDAAPTQVTPLVEAAPTDNVLSIVHEVLTDWLEENEATDFDENDVAHFFGLLGTAGYSILPNSAATPVAGEAGQWVRCDGKADFQAEEDWAWVCMPDGSVQLATWKEAHWEDESLWQEATYTIEGREGERYATPRFVWAEYFDEGCLHTLTPQPIHFQPKPSPHPDAV